MQEFIEIGKIVNSYGIKGFMKIIPYTDDIRRFDQLKSIYIEKKKQKIFFKIEEIKYQKNLVLIKLEGINSINDIEEYKNCYIKIERKNAINLPKDTYFIIDLIGLEVYTDKNILLGNIIDIFPTGSNDVYVVKDKLGKQVLLPAISEVIKDIDIQNKKVVVHLLPGLI